MSMRMEIVAAKIVKGYQGVIPAGVHFLLHLPCLISGKYCSQYIKCRITFFLFKIYL